ncbi:odorant receptor [Holotrichia oblita]|uniref:Odorant receptor n=1 Tax=Holotrichia oblita TaxID=644536 RepID=A0ACB9SYS4_HOLOL|nr:odorant receptor [Holotrichia oblita]
MAEIISVSTSHFLGLFKLSVLWKNRASIADALNALHTGVFLPNSRRSGLSEKILIKNCITKVYMLIAFHSATLVATVFNIIGSSLVTKFKFDDYELWKMPWIPFRLFPITTTIVYYTIYVYQTVTLILFACIIITTDLMVVAVLVHITTQFHILASVMRTLVENNSVNYISEQYDLYLRKKLKYAAYYHQELIKLTDRFEELFNMLVLAIFMGNCIVLCFGMYLMSSGELELNQLISEFTYLITVVMQIFLYCYYGNMITEASDAISFACYETDFVGTDLRFQKGLLLIMMRSQRPIVLTAGKFAQISLAAFVAENRDEEPTKKKPKSKILRIGTWNIRSINNKEEELEEEFSKAKEEQKRRRT